MSSKLSLAVAGLTMLAVVTDAAPAVGVMRAMRPINVRMQLYVGTAPTGVIPRFQWRVADRRNERDLKITMLNVFGAGTTPLGLDAAVAPYRIKFRLAGDRNAVLALLNAPPGQLLDVRGLARLDGGARFLMLDAVSPAAVATPPQPGP